MITRRLTCKLDDSEILMRGQQLAAAEQEYVDVENARKEAAANFKIGLQAIDERIHLLSRAISDREEIRDVECMVQDDTVRMKHNVIRLDTGEVVQIWDFTDAERQGSLL